MVAQLSLCSTTVVLVQSSPIIPRQSSCEKEYHDLRDTYFVAQHTYIFIFEVLAVLMEEVLIDVFKLEAGSEGVNDE